MRNCFRRRREGQENLSSSWNLGVSIESECEVEVGGWKLPNKCDAVADEKFGCACWGKVGLQSQGSHEQRPHGILRVLSFPLGDSLDSQVSLLLLSHVALTQTPRVDATLVNGFMRTPSQPIFTIHAGIWATRY